MGFVLLLAVVGLSLFGMVYILTRLRLERQGYTDMLPQSVVQVNLLDNDDAVVVAEGRGRLVFANPKARTWFNLNGGEPDLELMAGAVQPADTFMELFSKEGQASFRIGTRRVEASSHYIPRPEMPQVVVIMREIGAATHERETLDPVQALNAMGEIAQIMSQSLRLEEALEAILNRIGQVIPFDVGEVTLWDEDLQILRPRGRSGDSAYFEQFDSTDGVYHLDDSYSGWIARYRQPLLIPDTRLRPDVGSKLRDYPFRSYLGVPLIVGERFIGALELGSRSRVAFDHEDLLLLQAIAGQTGIAVENARLNLTQNERIAELSGLQQIAGVMTSLRDRRTMYAQLTSRISGLMNVEMCGILLYDPEQEALVGVPPFHGVPDAIVQMYRVPLPEGSPARAIYEGRDWWYSNNVRVDDLVQSAGLVSLAEAVGVRTTALVQMVVGNRQFGVVQVANKRDSSGFSENDMRLLTVFASQAAIVVENARLFDEEQRRAEELAGLQQISQAIGAFNHPDELYAQINERIAKLMHVQISGILLYDELSNQLVSRPPFHGVDDDMIRYYQIPVTPGTSLHRLFTEQDFYISNELRTDPMVRDSGLDKLAMLIGVRQTMLVPLIVSGRRLGLVQVSNRLDGGEFTEADARVLSIFAAQVGVIIDNERLYREMQQRANESEGLRRIAEIVSQTAPIDEIIATLVQETASLLKCEICMVGLLDERTGQLSIRREAIHGAELDEPIVVDTYSPGYQASVLMSRRPFLSNNMRSDARVLPIYRSIAERFNFDAAIQVPLIVQDRSIGEMTAASRGSRQFEPDDLLLLNAVGAQLSTAIDRFNLYRNTDADLRIRLLELDALTRISNELNRTTELDRILDVTRSEAQRTTSADSASIAILAPAEDWPDSRTPILSRRIGAAKNLTTLAPIELQAIANREIVAIEDYAEGQLEAQPPEARSAIAAPILFGEQTSGVLHVYAARANAFSAQTRDFVGTLVSQLAIAFANEARYREQLERSELLSARTEQLNQIFELGKIQRSGGSLEDVLDAVASAVSETVGYNIVVISVVDAEKGVTRRVAQFGLPLALWEERRSITPPVDFLQTLLQPRFRISGSYFIPQEETEEMEQEGIPFIPGVESEREMGGLRQWRPKDALIVPLRGSTGDMVGLMSVDDPRDGSRPTLRVVEALETFASQAAFAIENYQLVEAFQEEAASARRDRDRLEQLYLVASEIQRAADIPTRLQVVADGIRAAGWGRVAITLRDQNYNALETITAGFDPQEVEEFKQHLLPGEVWSQRIADPEFRRYRLGQAYYIRYDDPWVTENKLIAGMSDAGVETPTLAPKPTPADGWNPLDTVYLPLYGLDRSRLIGIITMGSPADGKPPTEASIRPIELFAAQAATAIENTRLLQQTNEAAQQEARINEVMEAVSSTLDLEEIIRGVASGFQPMIAFTRMSVALLDEENESFNVTRVRVGSQGEVEIESGDESIPVDDSAMGYAAQSGFSRVYYLETDEEVDDYVDLKAWRESGERTALVVPMMAGGRAVGALHMGSELAAAYGFERQLPLVSRVASLTAVAIENAQLFRQTIYRERYASALRNVAQAVSERLDMASALDTICGESNHILAVDGTYIFFVEGDQLLGIAARGPQEERFVGFRVAIAQADPMNASLIRERQPAVVDLAAQPDNPLAKLFPGISVSSVLGVPLMRESDVIGTLIVIRTDPKRKFSDTDVERAADFGLQASIAIGNAQLHQATLELQSFNQSIIESIQQGIVVLDRDGRIRTVNSFMRSRYNWGEDALGKSISDYRPEFAQYLGESLQRVLTSGVPDTRYEVRTVDEAGRSVVLNFYLYPLLERGAVNGVVLLVEDVTARAVLEADVATRAEQLSVLTDASSRLTAVLEPEAVINLMFEQLDRILAYDSATLWLRHASKLVIRGARGYADADSLIGLEAEIADSSLFREIASRGQVLNIPDMTRDPRFPPTTQDHPMRSWMGVSLVSRGNLAGLLVLEKAESGFYNPTHEQLALTFANQFAVALENATLFQKTVQAAEENTRLYREAAARARELDQQTRRLSLLYRVSNSLTQSLDLEDVFETTLRETAETLGTDYGSAYIFEPDMQMMRLVIEYPRGDRPPDERDVVPVTNYVVVEVRRALQPLVISNIPAHPEADSIGGLAGGRRILSGMFVPLAVGGQFIGLMVYNSLNQFREFTPEQVEVAQTITLQAAIAVQNANLLGQSLARTRELETLFDATQSILATLNLDEVLHNFALQVVVALQADGCTILNWQPEANTLSVALDLNAQGETVNPPGTTYSLADYPMRQRALTTRQMLLMRIDDPNLSDAEAAMLAQRGAYSHVITPMIVREQSVGLIEIEITSEARQFTAAEVRLAKTLTAQAAVAIENASLQTETASKLEELFVINDLSTALAGSIDTDQIHEIVRSRLLTLVKAQWFMFAVLDGDQVTYPVALRDGAPFELGSHPLADDEVSFVIKSRTVQRLSDAEIEDVLRNRGAKMRVEGARCFLGVPLISGDAVVGALVTIDQNNPRAFNLNDQRILSTVGAQIAVAIQNARFTAELEQAVQQRTAELQRERDNIDFLLRLTTSLTSSLDINLTLNRALEMMVEAVGAQMGAILGIDNISESLISRAGINTPILDENNRLSQHEGLAGWVIQTQQSLIVPDVQEDYRWLQLGTWEHQPRAAIAALLEANEETLGVVMLFSTEPNTFNDDQLKLVTAAAKQVASAMNNADLYTLIREQAERLGAMVRREQVDSTKNLAIVESIADGVMVANQGGDITQFNSAAERILGLSRRQVIGTHISSLAGLYSSAGGQNWLETLQRWTEDPTQHRPGEEVRAQLELDNGRFVSVILSPVNLGDQFLGTVSVFRDVTREIEVDRMKSEFVATVSHELRTPMTSVKGYADLLLLGAAGPLSEQQKKFLTTIKTNADRLSVLVNELLDISRLDRGVIKLNLQPTNFEDVAEIAVRQLNERMEAEQKKIDVVMKIARNLPLMRADFDRITEVLTHLITNAFNYTKAGGKITIAAKAAKRFIVFSVADTGIGIAKEKQDRIWNRFFRDEDEPVVMETSGAGLGLSIVKELVEMHQGEIWLESEVGVGTTFYVRIPAFTGDKAVSK